VITRKAARARPTRCHTCSGAHLSDEENTYIRFGHVFPNLIPVLSFIVDMSSTAGVVLNSGVEGLKIV